MILTKRIIVCVYLITSMTGCAATAAGLKKGWDDFWGSGYVSIPSPRPGLVLPINRSPAVWAECWLFEGDLGGYKDIIVPGRKGASLTFSKTPIKHFIINPPVSVPYSNGVMSTVMTVPLLLPAYPADYTLLVFHKNFRGWVVKIETRRFSTTGNPLNEYYISGGRRIYADKIIKLAKSKPYKRRQFRFHRTFYPGEALKSLLGLE